MAHITYQTPISHYICLALCCQTKSGRVFNCLWGPSENPSQSLLQLPVTSVVFFDITASVIFFISIIFFGATNSAIFLAPTIPATSFSPTTKTTLFAETVILFAAAQAIGFLMSGTGHPPKPAAIFFAYSKATFMALSCSPASTALSVYSLASYSHAIF